MEKEYVGIDLHRRRSVIYRMDQAGEKIDSVRVDNEPSEFAKAVSVAPVGSDVIVEATYGWYWGADLLKEMGYEVHLANPHGNDWGHRRVKNDERDARDLADLLRLGRLAEAWIAPPKTRELREMIRFRIKLSHVRTGLKAQVHAPLQTTFRTKKRLVGIDTTPLLQTCRTGTVSWRLGTPPARAAAEPPPTAVWLEPVQKNKNMWGLIWSDAGIPLAFVDLLCALPCSSTVHWSRR
jgi:transposase